MWKAISGPSVRKPPPPAAAVDSRETAASMHEPQMGDLRQEQRRYRALLAAMEVAGLREKPLPMPASRAVVCGMTRRRSGLSLVFPFGACAVALVLASCGGGPTDASSTTTTHRQASTTTSPPTAAVLAAYRASPAAFQQVVETANPTLPALTQTMTGVQLDSVRRTLEVDKLDGIIGKRSIPLYPRLASIHAANAVVLDCTFDSSELIYAATGKPVPPVTPPQHEAVRSQLTEVPAGIWKVAVQHVTTGGCPAGY